MTVSVVVPAYNAQNTIGRVLKALSEQNYSKDFEIIVVDDGSVDQTAQIIRSFPKVQYVYQDNAGPAAARNHGARLAKGEFLAFTDSDCIAHLNWITELMTGFAANDVGVVMGSYGIANPKSLLAECVHKEILFRHKFLLPDFPKVFGSYNFCVKKNVFDKAGGFDISFRQASGEDNDLSYKIGALGWRIYFQRQALVDHFHPTQVRKYLNEQFRHGYWRVVMYKKHPSMTAGDGYTFWKDIIEVPWSAGCLLGIFLSPLNFISCKSIIYFLVMPFLMFQIFFAGLMLKNISRAIYWGFILFLRSFSRTLGLSTGIFQFFGKKNLNKS